MAEPVNTIFIVGAGASKQAGVPLMNEFIDVARALRRSDDVGSHAADFDTVLAALSRMQVVHSKSQFDLQNIETVFSAFEFARVIKSFCGYDPISISGLAEAAKGFITHTVEATLNFPSSDSGPQTPVPYNNFVALLLALRKATAPHRVSVITFNYDFALDFALRDYPHINLGLTGQQQHADEIVLLKLHGSINWAFCGECATVVPISLDNFKDSMRRADYVKLNRFRFGHSFATLSHCNIRVAPKPFIAPPTWNKGTYHEKLSPIWSLASTTLAKADNIIVIGYSLPETDMFFRQLYALGTVGEHLLERFWVFNPDESGEVRMRFERLLGPGAQQRFRYFAKKFHDAIPILAHAFGLRTAGSMIL
jgi:hypothetical protein